MSDAWYYADYKGQIGPVTLQELEEALRHLSGPENVLVWRDGFTDWVRAGDVPEFRAQTAMPPQLPREQMPTWRVKWWWYPIPFISLGVGSQVGRKVMIWNSAQRRKAKHEGDFKERGIENVNLQIKHANFAPEKDAAARRWVVREEQKWPRRMFFLGIVGAIIAAASLYLMKR